MTFLVSFCIYFIKDCESVKMDSINFLEIGEECKCYEIYDQETFNETNIYQRISGETVLKTLAFDKDNLTRNAVEISIRNSKIVWPSFHIIWAILIGSLA